METERLIMRDVREEDIPVLAAQHAEPEARTSILSGQWEEDYNRKDLEKAIAWAKHPRREIYQLSVTLKTCGTLIGSCGIGGVRRGSFGGALGWHYGHRYRGNGYATEAARGLLRIGFELGEVYVIYADAFVDNKASIRVMEKIGMTPCWNFGLINIMRGLSYGESRPTVRHSISKDRWLGKIK